MAQRVPTALAFATKTFAETQRRFPVKKAALNAALGKPAYMAVALLYVPTTVIAMEPRFAAPTRTLALNHAMTTATVQPEKSAT